MGFGPTEPFGPRLLSRQPAYVRLHTQPSTAEEGLEPPMRCRNTCFRGRRPTIRRLRRKRLHRGSNPGLVRDRHPNIPLFHAAKVDGVRLELTMFLCNGFTVRRLRRWATHLYRNYRGDHLIPKYPEWDSNPQNLVPETSAYAVPPSGLIAQMEAGPPPGSRPYGSKPPIRAFHPRIT